MRLIYVGHRMLVGMFDYNCICFKWCYTGMYEIELHTLSNLHLEKQHFMQQRHFLSEESIMKHFVAIITFFLQKKA